MLKIELSELYKVSADKLKKKKEWRKKTRKYDEINNCMSYSNGRLINVDIIVRVVKEIKDEILEKNIDWNLKKDVFGLD